MVLICELTLVLGAVAALCVARTRETTGKVLALAFFGLALAVVFLFHAPDVSLSQIAVGTVAVPLMVLLALARMNRHPDNEDRTAK